MATTVCHSLKAVYHQSQTDKLICNYVNNTEANKSKFDVLLDMINKKFAKANNEKDVNK